MIVSDVVKNGVVRSVAGEKVTVEIGCAADECQGCKASMFCRTTDDKVFLTLSRPKGLMLEVGDRVVLNGRLHNWLSGWLLLAGLPCIAVLLGIFAGAMLGWGDIATGGTCMGLLVLYYIILYCMRRRIDRKVDWEIVSREE